MSDFDKALSTALNLDNDFIQSTFTPPQFRLLGILAEGQNHTDQRIDLETLNAHGRNEHDASMSRLGKINGDTIHVHPDLVKKLLCDTVPEDYSYLNTSSFGRTRVRRENDSRVAGSGEPDGNITITPGITEGGLPFLFIGEGLGGDAHEMIIRKEMMKEWMNFERIPKGFRRSNRAIDAAVFGSIVQSVKDWREYWSKL